MPMTICKLQMCSSIRNLRRSYEQRPASFKTICILKYFDVFGNSDSKKNIYWPVLFRSKRLKFDFFHTLVFETKRFELTKKIIRICKHENDKRNKYEQSPSHPFHRKTCSATQPSATAHRAKSERGGIRKQG